MTDASDINDIKQNDLDGTPDDNKTFAKDDDQEDIATTCVKQRRRNSKH